MQKNYELNELSELFNDFNIKNINNVIYQAKEKGDKQLLEIYSLRMQLKDTEKELRFYEEENDTILKQINEILISEENNISLLLKEIYNEADFFFQIENFFSEFDNQLSENLNFKLDEARLNSENNELKEKLKNLEETLLSLNQKYEFISKLYSDFFEEKDNENEEKEEKILELELLNEQKNEEINKFLEEKKKLINEYESKLNLKNIRLELEMDDIKRNSCMSNEKKGKIVSKSKYHESFTLNENINAKKIVKKN